MAEIPQAALDFINARCPRNELAPSESQAVDSTDTNECFIYLLETMYSLLPLVTLETPATITADPGDGQITITCAVVPHAIGYYLTRDGISIYSGIYPTFTDTGVVNGEEHTYQFYAFAPGYVTSGPVTITTEAGEEIPTLTQPSLAVTSGDGQLSVAVTPDSNATSTVVEASSDNFATIAGSQSGGSSPLVITGLTNDTAYKVRGHSTAPGFNNSPTTVASGTYTPVASGGGAFAYWVANDDGHIPTEIEFLAGTAIPITSGQTSISYDLTAQTTDRFVFLAEPIGEPLKAYKYASALDQENLGNDGQFNVGVDLTTLRYYPSNAQTSNTSFPIQLKTTA